MDMDEDEAIESLKTLGLSGYEAKVFTALQRTNQGTARDIHRAADIPRSQVYGAAESLENQGLVEVSQSKPIQYRAVSLEEAKEKLESQFNQHKQRAFNYLEQEKQRAGSTQEKREEIWTVRGKESIDRRIDDLISDADESIYISATDSNLVRTNTLRTLSTKDELGVNVVVLTDDEDLLERARETGLKAGNPPDLAKREDKGGRFLMTDDEAVLLSVIKDNPNGNNETAIWSKETAFASVLIQLVRQTLKSGVDLLETKG